MAVDLCAVVFDRKTGIILVNNSEWEPSENVQLNNKGFKVKLNIWGWVIQLLCADSHLSQFHVCLSLRVKLTSLGHFSTYSIDLLPIADIVPIFQVLMLNKLLAILLKS